MNNDGIAFDSQLLQCLALKILLACRGGRAEGAEPGRASAAFGFDESNDERFAGGPAWEGANFEDLHVAGVEMEQPAAAARAGGPAWVGTTAGGTRASSAASMG